MPTTNRLAAAILRRLDALGHRATVAIAGDVDTARTLATWRSGSTHASGVDVVGHGEARVALGPLPLVALAWTDPAEDPEARLEAKLLEATETLAALGIERVRDLYALDGHPLPSRLEEAGPHLARRARAERGRPLRTHRPAARIVERFELDRGTEDLEPLLFIVRRLVTAVSARLDGRGESTAQLRLRWLYEPGLEHAIDDGALRPRTSRQTLAVDFGFARPSRDPRVLFDVVRERLEVPGFVRALELEARRVAPDPGVQLDLFSRHPQKVEAAAGLVSRLQARLGREAVFSPRVVDTHRPEAGWRAAPFDIERALAEQPARPRRAPVVLSGLLPSRGHEDRALPAVDERLSVTGMPERSQTPLHAGGSGAMPTPKAWPKPVPRSPESEPPPPLPPRPTLLLARPEPVRIAADGRTLTLAKETVHVTAWSGFERLETEWWTASPLQRDYRTAHTQDGRKLWLFTTPNTPPQLHGYFD